MYHKIQPEQIKLHAFSSPSGDINFNSGTNYVYANLSRVLSGNFNINGSLFVNGSSIFASDPSNTSTGSNSFIFGGTNNNVSGGRNGFINSYSSSNLGSGNLGINTRNSNFDTGTSDNTILAGKGINFNNRITGSTVIKDQTATSLNVDKKQSLIISFQSGTFFENGNVSIEDGDLYVSSLGSGLFSGDLHALGTIFENGVPVATTGDLGVLSGALNTRILNTGAYAVAASGALNTRIINTGAYAVAASGALNTRILNTGAYAVAASGALNTSILNTGAYAVASSGALNTRIINTGAYAVAASGALNTSVLNTGAYAVASSGALNTRILNTGAYAVAASGALNTRIINTGAYAVAASGALNTRMNTSVFTSGEQTIYGAKTFHENLNLSQSLIIGGASGELNDVEAGTEIVPASYDDAVGVRGLVAYSGEFLYLKISDSPPIWARHSGTINWP
jgi:hypothetical protein